MKLIVPQIDIVRQVANLDHLRYNLSGLNYRGPASTGMLSGQGEALCASNPDRR
jgi:hypothetical protein